MFARQSVAAVSMLGAISIAALISPQLDTFAKSSGAEMTHYPATQNPYTAAELFSGLIKHRHWQESHLGRFSVVRTYKVENNKGKMLAEEVVVMDYKAPGTKTFTTTSADGSAFIRGHVFKQLMKREAGRAKGSHDQDDSISPENYVFEILAQEQIDSAFCTVVHAIPKRKATYLFEGKIWIDNQDFAVLKVMGHLAKSPSFWIKRVDFARQYQRIDGFWLPIWEQSVAEVRLYGTKILTIDYQHYTFAGPGAVSGSAGKRAPFVWEPSTPHSGRAKKINLLPSLKILIF